MELNHYTPLMNTRPMKRKCNMKYPEHEMEWICPMPVWRFTFPNHIELNARISARVYELM